MMKLQLILAHTCDIILQMMRGVFHGAARFLQKGKD